MVFFFVSETVTEPAVKWTNYDIILFPVLFLIWHLKLVPFSNPPTISYPMWYIPGGHFWNTYLRWVGSLRFICGSGTRRFHLRMSGPKMGSGVSPTVRMSQWWSRWWPPWDAPRHQKVALLILSRRAHALPLRLVVVRYDLNTLRPRKNGRHFADDMFKCIFLNVNVWIPIEISMTFVPKGSLNNNPALFQMMAWRRPGDKPLSEPMMVSSLTHICVTRPQWVNGDLPTSIRLTKYQEYLAIVHCFFSKPDMVSIYILVE